VVAHKLKPLADLFAPPKVTPLQINWEDNRYIPLLYAIENAIKMVYSVNPELTDSAVILALDQLALKPEVDSNDAVIKEISLQLRLLLSITDYSHDEVKMALRKILRSVKRHKDVDGIRGYLNFIAKWLK